jgi:hypothetical protein
MAGAGIEPAPWGGKSSGIRSTRPVPAVKLSKWSLRRPCWSSSLTTVRTPTDLRRGFQRFLADRYPNAKTVTRYLNAWSALATFLEHRKIISPAQVTYQLCIDYPQFRTNAPKELMRSRSWNTALTELKVFSAILQQAVRRSYITANPCVRLGLKRTPAKRNDEIKPDEVSKIEEALKMQDAWMRDWWLVACGLWLVACGLWLVACGLWLVACGLWLVAMRQGCRISEKLPCRFGISTWKASRSPSSERRPDSYRALARRSASPHRGSKEGEAHTTGGPAALPGFLAPIGPLTMKTPHVSAPIRTKCLLSG